MDDTVCGCRYDTLHILQCQFPLYDSPPKSFICSPKALYCPFHVVLGNLPYLTFRIREAVVDGLDHKYPAKYVGHSAVSDNRVLADSADAYYLQPGAVTVEQTYDLHVQRFLHLMAG